MRASEPTARRGAHHHHSNSNSNNIYSPQTTVQKQGYHHDISPHNQQYMYQEPTPPKNPPFSQKLSLLHHTTKVIMTPYVLQGIYYFLRHSVLWKTSLCPVLWTLVFVVCAFVVLLPLAFIPQGLALSTIMTPWLGFPLAFILAFLELLVIVMIFSAIVLLPITDKIFDQVLILRGHASLVEADAGGCCGCCNWVSVLHLIMAIVTLPINLIPVVGTVLWLFLNGRFYAWDAHAHYHYDLKRRTFPAQRRFVGQRWYSYHLFGMQAMALELIPVANVLFVFTNAVAAALWAADMEDQLLLIQDGGGGDGGDGDKHGAFATISATSQSYPTEETILQPTSVSKGESYGP